METETTFFRAAKWLTSALHDAALHARKEPPRTALWPLRSNGSYGPYSWRLIVLIVCTSLGVGFTAGSVAIHYVWNPENGLATAEILGAMECSPLLFAVRWPLVAWRVMATGMLAAVVVMSATKQFAPWPVTAMLAQLVVLFLLALGHDRKVQLGAGVLIVGGVVGPAVVFARMPAWFGLILAALVLAALAFGDAVGGRSAAEANLAVQEELRRLDREHQAVLEERARIARELHDVVAHHMSVIALQAEAAPYKIHDLPPAARATFQVLRDAARDALAETRRVVGLLREDDAEAERLPQPGLDRLTELTEQARRSGLSIEATIIGVPRPLAAGVDLSAYRIVQESLSNAARYAPGARVAVEIQYAGDHLMIAVVDDGPGSAADRLEAPVAAGNPAAEPVATGGGHGLVGMRERTTMLAGTLAAGPVADGPGWAVRAVIPYGDGTP